MVRHILWPRGLAAWESSFCNGWAQLANTTIWPFSMAMSEYLQICAFCNGRASWVLPAWPKIGFSEALLQNDVAYKLRRLFLNIASMEIWSLGLSFCSDRTLFYFFTSRISRTWPMGQAFCDLMPRVGHLVIKNLRGMHSVVAGHAFCSPLCWGNCFVAQNDLSQVEHANLNADDRAPLNFAFFVAIRFFFWSWSPWNVCI